VIPRQKAHTPIREKTGWDQANLDVTERKRKAPHAGNWIATYTYHATEISQLTLKNVTIEIRNCIH
jgi:hypothetical protein